MVPRRLSFAKTSSRDASVPRAFFLIIFIVLAVFAIDRFSGGIARNAVQETGGLVAGALASATAVLPSAQGFATRASLVSEIEHLEDVLMRRSEHDARFAVLSAENEELRALARLAEDESLGLSAHVLSSFSTSPYGTFIIGAGARHGVREGATVLTPGGFVLGSVVAVQDRTATVEALFAPGKETEVLVNATPFILHGRGGGNARAEVPRDADIQEGDVVTVPSLASRPAGIIAELKSASSSAASTLYVRTPTNLDSLRFVYVVQ